MTTLLFSRGGRRERILEVDRRLSGKGPRIEIVIDLGEGPYRPEAKDERRESDEIEFDLNLLDGTNKVRIVGSSARARKRSHVDEIRSSRLLYLPGAPGSRTGP